MFITTSSISSNLTKSANRYQELKSIAKIINLCIRKIPQIFEIRWSELIINY